MSSSKNRSSPATERARAKRTAALLAEQGGETRYLVVDEGGQPSLAIKILDIPETGLPVLESVSKSTLASFFDDEITVTEDLRADVRVEPEGSDVFRLRGKVSLELTHDCVRCLEPVPFPLDLDLDIRLHEGRGDSGVVQRVDVESAGMRRMTKDADDDDDYQAIDDDEDFVTFEGGVIDLLPIFREQAILCLPMHPSCESEGAKPPVPCRYDALQAHAKEHGMDIDPRWQGLKLLADQKRSDDVQ